MAKKEYQRTTREISFNNLQPQFLEKIRKYLEKKDIQDFEGNILMCVETTSEKISQGFFANLFGSGNYGKQTVMAFSPNRLLWSTLDNKNEIVVNSAKLNEIEIKDFSSPLIEDTGLDVFGFINGSTERVTAFLGLGEENISQKFKQTLAETIAKTT